MNLLPNTNVESMVKSFAVKSNDLYHSIYIGSLVKSVMSLHKLINNKIDLKFLLLYENLINKIIIL